MARHEPLEWMTKQGWTRIDIYAGEEQKFGNARDVDHRRDIYSNGCGGLIEVLPDGTFANLVMQDAVPENAPHPMFGETKRNGVIGYMCKIDFECELGGTRAVVHTSAEAAMCCGTCGVVEVEVIGRRIVVDESFDDMEEPEYAEYVAKVAATLKAIDVENENGK